MFYKLTGLNQLVIFFEVLNFNWLFFKLNWFIYNYIVLSN